MPGKTSITNEAFFEYTDSKENIKEVLRLIKKLSLYKRDTKIEGAIIPPNITLEDLKEIKKILESGRKASDIDKNN